MGAQSSLFKGQATEELLRCYFIQAGYYAVRGVPFIYENFDVTDIDVWLYGRASSVSREITIVDCKNKKTPQAIERIFWTRGLQIATNATAAVVATTDKRQAVKDFGRKLGITVLDGSFLSRLKSFEKIASQRLPEEDFQREISGYLLGKLDGDWAGRVSFSKSLLASGLSFDSCNEWLEQARFFAEQLITKPSQKQIALRCLYLVCSFIAISIDYCLRDLAFLEQSERESLLSDGFKFGSKGSSGMSNVMSVAMGLVEQHTGDGRSIAMQIRRSVENQIAAIETASLSEHFAKSETSKSLFTTARELEALAMKASFINHRDASIELKSFLGVLLDYWKIDRVVFSNSIDA
jgi:hypothetical protein